MDKLVKTKLNNEIKKVSGQKAKAMAPSVKDALISFSKQNKEFGQAILESDKSFSDCMNEVAKGVGNSISDLEAYKKAVKFYFSGADIKFHMTINLAASAGGDDSGEAMSISLEDLLEV